MATVFVAPLSTQSLWKGNPNNPAYPATQVNTLVVLLSAYPSSAGQVRVPPCSLKSQPLYYCSRIPRDGWALCPIKLERAMRLELTTFTLAR